MIDKAFNDNEKCIVLNLSNYVLELVLLVLFLIGQACTSDVNNLATNKKITTGFVQQVSVAKSKVSDVKPKMIKIQGGSFTMGCISKKEKDCMDRETPAHEVSLDSYSIGETEITNEQYAIFLNDMENFEDSWLEIQSDYCKIKKEEFRYQVEEGFEEHPVVQISWYGAITYCNWLSKKEKRTPVYSINGKIIKSNLKLDGYRLPTEAEWEYAARSRGQNMKYAGTNEDEELSIYANYSNSCGSTDKYKETAPVCSFSPNDLGLYDMSGNICEWCEDWYSKDFYNNSEGRRISNPCSKKGSTHIVRGGSWNYNRNSCRVFYRLDHSTFGRHHFIGFRIVLPPSNWESQYFTN